MHTYDQGSTGSLQITKSVPTEHVMEVTSVPSACNFYPCLRKAETLLILLIHHAIANAQMLLLRK